MLPEPLQQLAAYFREASVLINRSMQSEESSSFFRYQERLASHKAPGLGQYINNMSESHLLSGNPTTRLLEGGDRGVIRYQYHAKKYQVVLFLTISRHEVLRKFFQVEPKFSRWYHFQPYLKHVPTEYFEKGWSHISFNQFQKVSRSV